MEQWFRVVMWLSAVVPALTLGAVDAPVTSLRVGLSALSFNYEEFDTAGNTLDREEGWIPGLTATLSRDFGRWFAEAGLNFSSGRVDYTSPAVASRTSEDILDVVFTAGMPLWRDGEEYISLLGGLGYRDWRRDIQSTSAAFGLNETYRWVYAVLGLRGEREFANGLRAVMDAQLTRPLNPHIKVDYDIGYDSSQLDLGERNGYRLRLALEKRIDNATSYWVAPWYEYWELGRSDVASLTANGSAVGTVFEPRSETGNYGIEAGLRWDFR